MSDSNGKVAPWLADLGIKPGEFFTDSKLRARRAMKSRCFSPAARVHICLGLHTMGFHQERAVKMEASKQVDLTPIDIAAETGLQKQNIRRHLEELQAVGLAAVEGWTKGRVVIYAWAIPRPVEAPAKAKNGNQIDYHFDDRSNVINKLEAGKLLRPLLARFRIQLPDKMVITQDYLSTVKDALRDYQKAKMVLTQALNGNLPADASNKEERNERNIERNLSVGRSESVVEEPPPPPIERPTDRPIDEPENPFKPKIRTWLESRIKIPGYSLDEPELALIAETIKTEAHFTQFQEAAAAQKEPRGWRVFVKIARQCAARHKHYAQAATEDADKANGTANGKPHTPQSYLEDRYLRVIAERRAKGNG